MKKWSAIRSPRRKNKRRAHALAAVLGGGVMLSAGALAAQPPSAAGESPVLIDGLAAVLGDPSALEEPRAVLRSDVELRARLSLLAHDVNRALFGELPGSLLRATLDQLLGEQLIALEAERVQIAKPKPAEVAAELATIEREAGGRHAIMQLLARLDASHLELEAMAERRALIGAFLRANLEGVNVVSEREIDERMRTDGARLEGQTPVAARELIRAVLAREALARNIEHWVRVLRARTRVRVFAVFETP
jgi:hypothetical protein